MRTSYSCTLHPVNSNEVLATDPWPREQEMSKHTRLGFILALYADPSTRAYEQPSPHMFTSMNQFLYKMVLKCTNFLDICDRTANGDLR